jgi:hypothetical protein
MWKVCTDFGGWVLDYQVGTNVGPQKLPFPVAALCPFISRDENVLCEDTTCQWTQVVADSDSCSQLAAEEFLCSLRGVQTRDRECPYRIQVWSPPSGRVRRLRLSVGVQRSTRLPQLDKESYAPPCSYGLCVGLFVLLCRTLPRSVYMRFRHTQNIFQWQDD